VEIHTGNIDQDGNPNVATPTFKWSRENASVIFPIVAVAPVAGAERKTMVTLAHCGHDDKLSLYEGDWVEIVDDDYTLQNCAEPLLQVYAIDGDQVTLDGIGHSHVGSDLNKHPLLRRWDQTAGVTHEGVLQIVKKNDDAGTQWLPLEEGVQIQFQFQSDSRCRTGDYWLIPARTATGDVEWPTEKGTDGKAISSAMSPHGVEHHYAPLAVISVKEDGTVTVSEQSPPCRHSFQPLNERV
jgi:hypothetical protein